jgi:hypothetical protein
MKFNWIFLLDSLLTLIQFEKNCLMKLTRSIDHWNKRFFLLKVMFSLQLNRVSHLNVLWKIKVKILVIILLVDVLTKIEEEKLKREL